MAVKLFLSENVETEITTLANLSKHPNLVPFIGVIFQKDEVDKLPQVALVMKYMARGSLHEVLVNRRSPHFNPAIRCDGPKVLDLAAQVKL